MMASVRELGGWLLIGAALLSTAAGCELIATADRSRIPGPSGGTGGVGGEPTGGGGEGGDPGECTSPDDCPGTASDCLVITCEDRTCDQVVVAAGASCDDDGGNVCDGAGECVECLNTEDCDANEVCDVPSNTCFPEQCFDGVENGSESDVDCGGPDCPGCENGDACVDFGDCVSQFCDNFLCAPCGDDGDCQSTDFCDSADNCVAKGDPGDSCGAPNECLSDECADGVCCDTACDGTCEACDLVGTEGTCTPHPAGTDPETECGASDSCNGLAAPDTECSCDDGIVNFNESDIDCGGGTCPTCADGDDCNNGADCTSLVCDVTCQTPICGDNVQHVALGEVCDDGNNVDGDGCSANCLSDETCGNDIIDTAVGEVCDDGNTTDGDGCSANCLSDETCGNNVIDTTVGEVCDDGNTTDGDGCSGNCLSDETCGNNIIDVAAGEVCDDGNTTDGDGCSGNCLSDETCGNNVIDTAVGEVCDDGNTTGGDGCSGDCLSDETCGNNILDLDAGEVCDDGNTTGGDGCSSDCLSDETCGNSIVDVDAGEVCDDGNTTDGDGCSANCLSDETCGNDVVDTTVGEVCDDGNTTGGDGCSSDCLSDETCGNNIIDVDAGEVCDDGNTDPGDGCSADCTTNVSVVDTVPADGAIDVSVTSDIAIEFTQPMNAATLTASTVLDGNCTGSVQLSTDDFVTCVPFASATPVMSGGDTVATFTPAPGLTFNTFYKVRVTPAAESQAALPLEATFTQPNGFVTGADGGLCTDSVVVSQVYGGGGNSGATFTHDFVELHNRGETAVSLAGWSLQYANSTGSSWSVNALTGDIPAGGYFLVQLATGGMNGVALPAPDLTGTINMAGSSGKVALVSNTTTLSGSCPTGGALVDFVGFGTSTNCFEGSGPTGSLSSTLAAHRAGGGCLDGDDNSADFTAALPAPRNSASSALTCCSDDVALNETDDPNEADYCVLQFPATINMGTTDTTTVYGRVFETGVTEAAGDSGLILAELGYGPRDENPQHEGAWTYVPATFNVQVGNDDEYQADFTGLAEGDYSYVFRVSLDNGSSWTYCDIDGAGSNLPTLHFETTSLGLMIVTP